MSDRDLWVFGYGSLIWRADFLWAERRPAFISGWTRRFWQGSTDHRGVPGAPGRVVTLVKSDQECWGMAYRLDADRQNETMARLDHREKGGYERLSVPLYFSKDDSVTGITWHATPENENYLGEAPIQDIAEQIAASTGPSGDNTEYLLRLDEALTTLNVTDKHVREIAELVRYLLADKCLSHRRNS